MDEFLQQGTKCKRRYESRIWPAIEVIRVARAMSREHTGHLSFWTWSRSWTFCRYSVFPSMPGWAASWLKKYLFLVHRFCDGGPDYLHGESAQRLPAVCCRWLRTIEYSDQVHRHRAAGWSVWANRAVNVVRRKQGFTHMAVIYIAIYQRIKLGEALRTLWNASLKPLLVCGNEANKHDSFENALALLTSSG